MNIDLGMRMTHARYFTHDHIWTAHMLSTLAFEAYESKN